MQEISRKRKHRGRILEEEDRQREYWRRRDATIDRRRVPPPSLAAESSPQRTSVVLPPPPLAAESSSSSAQSSNARAALLDDLPLSLGGQPRYPADATPVSPQESPLRCPVLSVLPQEEDVEAWLDAELARLMAETAPEAEVPAEELFGASQDT